MAGIPECTYRFGERYAVTEFIQCQNLAVRDVARSFIADTQDELVSLISTYIRDGYYYPFDGAGNPSASGQLLRYRKGCMSYHFKVCRDYVWALPCEVINTRCGYCAETANLATSILIACGIPNSWTVLGEVRTARENQLLGYHAWTECPFSGSQYVMETTVDEEGVSILAPAASAYDRMSELAQKVNIYYLPQSRYNASEYIGEGPLGEMMVQLMGKPANRVLLFGIERTLREKPSSLLREHLLEERLLKKLLLEAYRRM